MKRVAPQALSEFDLIAKYFKPLTQGAPGALALSDDAAFIRPRSGYDLVVTVDAVVEGVHFLADDPACDIAQKALRVNISDLAAKGAQPKAYLLTAAFPQHLDGTWLPSFALGLKRSQKRYGIDLIGGDTVSTPGPLSLSITAIGEVKAGQMIRRAGAKVGDDIWVSGTIGDAGLGLAVTQHRLVPRSEKQIRFLVQRYRIPEPRLEVGLGLQGLAHARVDISDGLIADLGHLATVSGVALEIMAEEVPLSSAARDFVRAGQVSLETLLTAGDDYELAFAAAPSDRLRVGALSARCKVPLVRIGRVLKGAGVTVVGADGKVLQFSRKGFTHF